MRSAPLLRASTTSLRGGARARTGSHRRPEPSAEAEPASRTIKRGLRPMDSRREARGPMYRRDQGPDVAHDASCRFVVEADDKRTARLNLISHLLEKIPHQPVPEEKIELPPRQERAYVRPPADSQTFVPTRFVVE